MSQESTERLDTFRDRVKTGLQYVEQSMSRLRRINFGLITAGILGSAASTLVAGIAAAQGGPVVGMDAPGWRLTCLLAAIFSFVTTVAMGFNQRLKIGQRLAKRQQCAGRLQSLEVALETGSRNWEEMTAEYEEIVKSYPELIP